ncbi:MAG: FkbM family methyltransferase [Candidatus Woesearchaeota archaeon]|jgi:FkbM family methyltransferase
MKKIFVALIVLIKIKNWTTYFKDYFGKLKNQKIIYELRNGIKYSVRGGTCDRGIINEIWIEKYYTPFGFKINEKDIIVDVGAQIGIFSVYAASIAKKGKVYSLEPMPENFEMLKINSKLNKLKNIIPINYALSDKNGKETMFLDDLNTGGHSLVNSGKTWSKNKINIQSMSFDKFVTSHKIKKIDFLKMDCEGSEYKIFFNASNATLKKIQKISMEYHNLDENRNVQKLKIFLEKNNFEVRVMTKPCPMLYATKK